MKPEPHTESTALTRREFVRASLLAASGVALGLKAADSGGSAPAHTIIAFSKPFQTMKPDDMASFVEEIGWSGIECPVRAQGQIEPERVGEDLPRLVEAFRRKGLSVPILVTDIASIRAPHAEEVLRVAAKLGIKRFRLGTFFYTGDRPLAQQLDSFGHELRDIGEACAELGVEAAVQNHSGPDRFAAPVWDAVRVLGDFHVRNVGMCFDICHATIEGGLSWPIQARLAEPLYTAVYVKDFRWAKGPDGWRVDWRPLGEGMVNQSFFTNLRHSGYSGLICQHHEYPLGDRADMVTQMRRDLKLLRDWLA